MGMWYEDTLTPNGLLIRAIREHAGDACFGSAMFGGAIKDASFTAFQTGPAAQREVNRDLRKITRAYANKAQWIDVNAFTPKRYRPGEDMDTYTVVGWRAALAIVRKLRAETDRDITFVIEDHTVRKSIDAHTDDQLHGWHAEDAC